MTELKTCKRCKLPKPIEAFVVRSERTDGRDGICRECKSKVDKIRRDRIIAERRAFGY